MNDSLLLPSIIVEDATGTHPISMLSYQLNKDRRIYITDTITDELATSVISQLLYDVLILKDFYHFNKRTVTCFRDLLELHKKGIEVVTMENGRFVFSEVPLNEELRVATYYSANKSNRDVEEAVKLEQDIFELFMRKKTSWTLTKHYADICNPHSDTEQVNLMELVKDRKNFDLVLTVSFTDVNGRTARFCKVREMMKKPIYSLKEGFLVYAKEIDKYSLPLTDPDVLANTLLKQSFLGKIKAAQDKLFFLEAKRAELLSLSDFSNADQQVAALKKALSQFKEVKSVTRDRVLRNLKEMSLNSDGSVSIVLTPGLSFSGDVDKCEQRGALDFALVNKDRFLVCELTYLDIPIEVFISLI